MGVRNQANLWTMGVIGVREGSLCAARAQWKISGHKFGSVGVSRVNDSLSLGIIGGHWGSMCNGYAPNVITSKFFSYLSLSSGIV